MDKISTCLIKLVYCIVSIAKQIYRVKSEETWQKEVTMKKKRIAAGIMSVIMAAGMLAGCGGSGGNKEAESAKTEDGKVNLKFYIWSDEENYMTEIAENYNKSQDKVTVEVVSIANDSYDDKLKVMLSAGSDADIVDIRTMNQVQQFQDSGAREFDS